MASAFSFCLAVAVLLVVSEASSSYSSNEQVVVTQTSQSTEYEESEMDISDLTTRDAKRQYPVSYQGGYAGSYGGYGYPATSSFHIPIISDIINFFMGIIYWIFGYNYYYNNSVYPYGYRH